MLTIKELVWYPLPLHRVADVRAPAAPELVYDLECASRGTRLRVRLVLLTEHTAEVQIDHYGGAALSEAESEAVRELLRQARAGRYAADRESGP